ncbi:MAG: hypothetical protein ABEK12_03550, partial [Candidatus Nanohaloarchaea archaeon]
EERRELEEMVTTIPDQDGGDTEEVERDVDMEKREVFVEAQDIIEEQTLPKEEREERAGELIEDNLLFPEYEDTYSDLLIDLFLQTGAETVTLGGLFIEPKPDHVIDISSINGVTAEGPLNMMEETWNNFEDITAMFDTRSDRFPDVQNRLENVSDLSQFRLEQQGVDPFLFTNDEVATVVARSPDLWTKKILLRLKGVSPALWAAQQVSLCAGGNDDVCSLIEQQIGGNPKRGRANWYLKQAYEEYLAGDWDAQAWFDTFYRLIEPGETIQQARKRRKQHGISTDPLDELEAGGDVDINVSASEEDIPEPDEDVETGADRVTEGEEEVPEVDEEAEEAELVDDRADVEQSLDREEQQKELRADGF